MFKTLALKRAKYVACILYLHKNNFRIEYTPIVRKTIKSREGSDFEVLELTFLRKKIPPLPSTYYFFNHTDGKSYLFLLTLDKYTFHVLEFNFPKVDKDVELKTINENYKNWKEVGYAYVFTLLKDAIKLTIEKIRKNQNHIFIENCGLINEYELLEKCGYDKNKYVLFVVKYLDKFEVLDLKKINILGLGILEKNIDTLTEIGVNYKRDLEAYKRFSIILKDALGLFSFWEKYGNIFMLILFIIFIMVIGTYFISQISAIAEGLKVVGENIGKFSDKLELILNTTKIIEVR